MQQTLYPTQDMVGVNSKLNVALRCIRDIGIHYAKEAHIYKSWQSDLSEGNSASGEDKSDLGLGKDNEDDKDMSDTWTMDFNMNWTSDWELDSSCDDDGVGDHPGKSELSVNSELPNFIPRATRASRCPSLVISEPTSQLECSTALQHHPCHLEHHIQMLLQLAHVLTQTLCCKVPQKWFKVPLWLRWLLIFYPFLVCSDCFDVCSAAMYNIYLCTYFVVW